MAHRSKRQLFNYISVLPPLELHLMIGSVTSLFNKMSTVCSNSETNVWRCVTSVTKILRWTLWRKRCSDDVKKVDLLESICILQCLPFVATLVSLNRVVRSCFGNTLDSDFSDHNEKFRSDYLAMDIQVTPKIHCIFYNVAEFCKITNKGLGLYSEQASQAVHTNFHRFWTN